MNEGDIYKIERPHPSLMKLYVIQAALSGPAALLVLPLLYFRYHSMRYRFDEHGVTMSWGVLMRREIHLTYSRIQDIHLVSGPIQRYLGLAQLLVQTASGSMGAEMVIEGLLEYEAVRDFLYAKMRGIHAGEGARALPQGKASAPPAPSGAQLASGAAGLGGPGGAAGAAALARQVAEATAELRGAREALERMAQREGA